MEVKVDEKIVIQKGSLRGEDGYKTFSIRVKEGTVQALDRIVEGSRRSRNEVINILLSYGVQHCEIKD